MTEWRVEQERDYMKSSDFSHLRLDTKPGDLVTVALNSRVYDDSDCDSWTWRLRVPYQLFLVIAEHQNAYQQDVLITITPQGTIGWVYKLDVQRTHSQDI